MSQAEDDSFIEAPEEETIPPKDMVAFNELRSCADLFRMTNSEKMNIRPDFEREIVWSDAAQTRFIDSLVKQLPIPSMCISIDYNTEMRIVIDGLQRISTIRRFFSDESWKLEELDDISKDISGKTVKEIKENYHQIYERIQNVTIPITVLRYNSEKESHNDYLFNVFHRLNTGGIRLNNQEIRNCIFSGKFNDLLKELNRDLKWIKIQKIKPERSYRYKKIELILRFFAFYDLKSKYLGKLTTFLNEYMEKNRKPSQNFIEEKKLLFSRVMNILEIIYQKRSGKMRFGYAQWEALLYGIGDNITYLEKIKEQELIKMFEYFLDTFSKMDLISGIYSKSQVISRLNKSKEIFSGS